MVAYFSIHIYRKSRAVYDCLGESSWNIWLCLREVYGSLWQFRRVFVESMAVSTGSVRQSKEVYGESTTVYVSIWAVYLSLGSLGHPRGGYRESRGVCV